MPDPRGRGGVRGGLCGADLKPRKFELVTFDPERETCFPPSPNLKVCAL